jgi:hypothetical protein
LSNAQGGHEILHLETKQIIVRHNVTVVPITPDVVKAVEALAKRDGVAPFKMVTKHGVVLYDAATAGVANDDQSDIDDNEYEEESDSDDDDDDDQNDQDVVDQNHVIAMTMCRFNETMEITEKFAHGVQHVITYSLKKALNKFGDPAKTSASKEMKHMLDRKCFTPIHKSELNEVERKRAMESLLFLNDSAQMEARSATTWSVKMYPVPWSARIHHVDSCKRSRGGTGRCNMRHPKCFCPN